MFNEQIVHRSLYIIALESPSPLLGTPTCQQQSLPLIFLLIEDIRTIKVRLIPKMDIIGALRGLKPFGELVLGAFLTQVVKGRTVLLITMFVLKDWRLLLASPTDPIPEVIIFAASSESPDNSSGW